MGALRLTGCELADVMADPSAAATLSVHGGVTHLIVDVDRRLDERALPRPLGAPGLALACPVIAVSPPDLVDSCDFADVLLAGDGPDKPDAVEAISRVIEANPVAAASYALLLRGTGESLARATSADAAPSGLDRAVLSGLVAESTCYSMLQSGAEFAAWRAGRPPRLAEDGNERIRVSREDDVLHITLVRPARRNALDSAMRDQLAEAFTLALLDPDLRVRLDGDGPSFSAGGDLDEFGSRPDPAGAHLTRMARSTAWLAHQLGPRLEVCLHGACLGSGIEIPAFAGAVLAAEDTVIGLPEVSLGLIPGAGGTVSITRRIGRRRTAFLGLSGTSIGVDTAVAWGLVDARQPA
ncbi:enoyl-CoA hydratase/isomerase family protein [uncultured Jatrophihabitans sp.]|uniref:enoyl-CoA hydratase/isomerase family protein n=1 Tax=uncultured Jatrophihabitans sp. TaxID=1610747 RepID=UPI0035CAE40D